MSTREIIAELPHLTDAELRAIEQRIWELQSRSADPAEVHAGALHLERIDNRLVLVGSRIVRQAEVEGILADFP